MFSTPAILFTLLFGSLSSAYNGSVPVNVSSWGTIDTPSLAPFLTDNPLPNGFPWGNKDVRNTNPLDCPHTGVTRRYDFTIKRGRVAPDGVEKDTLLINGQFPGPKIEANWGDFIEVTVHNKIAHPEEGTAMHWHGMLQKETPWYDGVPSVTQCPIAPGSTFTYRFRADVYGSTFYHAHYSAQYVDGVLGPMIIHGPRHADYDVDVGPIMLSDWYHRDYFKVLEDVAGNSSDFNVYVPAADNVFINGKMPADCSKVRNNTICHTGAQMSKFKFQSGKTYRLRLMNVGAAVMQRFSIDGHKLQVITQDMTPIIPYETDVVSLGAAQRADVLVKAIGQPKDLYWMRSTIGLNCSRTRVNESQAIIYYEKADRRAKPNTTRHTIIDNTCGNDPLNRTVPIYKMTPDPNPGVIDVIELDLQTNETGHHVWIQNNQTFRANYNNPLLLLANQKNYSYPYNPEWGVRNYGNNKSIRIVFNTKYQSAHPMHMHGHHMYVLAEGDGRWDGKTVVNPSNPLRRDVHMMRRFGYLVVQIDADNPGVWPYHCHIAWHASMGLSINVMERPTEITQMQIPMVMEQTCRDWDRYSKSNIVEQIDAGI
ncbi:MAG: hypothetical protein M1814_004226 [Vezdaea aestivalis]|nr:MAG: hypothetical protein M1814_004226 [Vezdaea aestivalis]